MKLYEMSGFGYISGMSDEMQILGNYSQTSFVIINLVEAQTSMNSVKFSVADNDGSRTAPLLPYLWVNDLLKLSTVIKKMMFYI
jgi:hypothetical protein